MGFVLAGHPEAAQKAVQELVSLVPGLGSLVTEQVQATINGRVTLGVVGVLGLLWSASGFASRLRHALGVVFRTEWVGLLTGRIRGTVIGVLMVAAFVALALFTGVEARLQATHRTTIASLFQAAAFALGGFVLSLTTYRLLTPGKGLKTPGPPPRRSGFHDRMASADGPRELVFTRLIHNSTALYGTIGGIFGLLAYLYATMWSLLIGAELSAVLVSRRPS